MRILRRCCLSVAVGVLVAASASPIAATPGSAPTKPNAPTASQPKDTLRFRPGTYQGKLTYAATADFQDQSVGAEAGGALEILVPDESNVVEGTFTFTAQGISAGVDGSGEATLVFDGVVTGRRDDPWLDPHSGSMTGSATVQGITVPIDAQFDAATMGESDLRIESASACQVGGRFALEIPGAVAGAGGSAVADGRWQVVRTGSLETPDEVWTLMSDAEALLSEAKTGNLDRNAWQDVVRRAARLESELKQDNKCKASNTRDLFISGIIDDLLDFALLHSDELTGRELLDILRIGKSDGAFADPCDPKHSRALRKGFHDHFVVRLDTVLNSEGIDVDVFNEEIDSIWAAGNLMPWDDVADQAKPHLDDSPPKAP